MESLAQKMARSMVWPSQSGAPAAGRITEAGVWAWAYTYVPKITGWLGQLGLFVAIGEVAGWVSTAADTEEQADLVLSVQSHDYYREILYDWNEAAKRRVAPSQYNFIAPVYAQAMKMADEPTTTMGKISALIGTFAKHVQDQWTKFPNSEFDASLVTAASGPDGEEVIDLGTGTMYIEPSAPPGAWVAPTPYSTAGVSMSATSPLQWLIVGVGLWSGWRALRG